MKTCFFSSDGLFKKSLVAATALALSACSLVKYQPLETISEVDLNSGYRFQTALDHKRDSGTSDMMVILMFSGGGTRAAALGYGVLEELERQKIWMNGKETRLIDQIDLVYGVSGGSVLAVYFSLYGADTIPSFEQRFLKQNFQRQVAKQVFSFANLPRLSSPEFGRGDLLQEQFESGLFRKTTFGDLAARRKGPFAVISATDMSQGRRLDFTQEYFDAMCLNLSDLPLARAVAASSAVPLLFAPVTLNNNGGNCGYTLPVQIRQAAEQAAADHNRLQSQTQREISSGFKTYEDPNRTEVYSGNSVYRQFSEGKVNKVVIINVNAQNQIDTHIDKSAAVPGVSEVLNAIINIPIDQYSQESLRRFRAFVDYWNEQARARVGGHEVNMFFVSLNLRDLPESQLRENTLNTPTSFYLPHYRVDDLKQAAGVLMRQSGEYKRLLNALAAPAAAPEATAGALWFVGEGPLPKPDADAAQPHELFEQVETVQ